MASAHQERARSLVEMAQMVAFCYKDFDDYEEAAAKKHLRPAARVPLERMRAVLETLDDWSEEPLHTAVQQVSDASYNFV